MEHFIYFPTTQYHLILSFFLREQNKAQYNSIILDESHFNKSFINKIVDSKNWDNIYVLKLSSRFSNFANRNIFYNSKYDEIFNIKNANVIVFTFGDDFVNLLVNSIYKNNNILMGEDGLFPYYGLAIVNEYHNLLKNEHAINKLKRFFRHKINYRYQFDIQRIDKFLLLNPEWLPQEVIQKFEIEPIVLDQKAIKRMFDELTSLYEYKKENIFNDFDIIYFDSDISNAGFITEKHEHEILCKIFNKLNDFKILIKLKPNNNELINSQRESFYNALQTDTACNFVINCSGAKYPWEIVYYNNATDFKDVIFMSQVFSTAFITPKKFFGIENNIICLQNIFDKELKGLVSSKSIDDFIDRIKRTYLSKSIYIPESVDDIRSSVSKTLLIPRITRSY